MLKRLNARFATKSSTDMEKLNDYGFMPSTEEVENPGIDWEELSHMRRTYNFEGDYHCKLCPKKVIMSERDLNDHLNSKVSHKQQFYSIILKWILINVCRVIKKILGYSTRRTRKS